MSTILEIQVPDIGNFSQVAVIEVHVKPGDTIKVDDPLITLESDKAAMEIPATASGKVEAVKVKVGDKVATGDLILTVIAEESAAKPAKAEEKLAQTSKPAAQPTISRPQQPAASNQSVLLSSPAVRRLARELDVDLQKIKGTGDKGRISKEDIKKYLQSGGSAIPVMPVVDFSQWGAVTTQPLSRIQKLSAGFLHRNWLNIPHVTQFDSADITHMEAYRQAHKAKIEKEGAKLTPLVFLMQAVVAALKKFPTFNASLAPDGENLIMKQYYHIGVAVDTPNGLVVPVIRDVDKKDKLQLAKDLANMSVAARAGKLTGEQMQGSCFSISSLGGIGGTAFTPIINAPDVAILGVSKSQMQPMYVDGQFVPRLMLPLSLSYDHRVIDGAVAARFIVALGEFLQDVDKL